MRTSTEPITAGLVLSGICAMAFLALSFVRIFGDVGSAVFGGGIIEATLNQPIWGTALALRIAEFVAALIFIHLLLGVAAWLIAIASRAAWPRSPVSQRKWALLWFVLLAAWILLANAAWRPWSSLGRPYTDIASTSWNGVDLAVLAAVGLGAMLLWTLVRAAAARPWRWPRPRTTSTIALCLLGGGVAASLHVSGTSGPVTQDRPNIIVIGLDSLRPDVLAGNDGARLAPAINGFLRESTVFSDTLTPLARTFPAWVSIVSGKHPHTTGAVMNLLPRELVSEGETLPKLMARAGYRTIYATDEVRFSNLDRSYGFERMIAPPIGSADFLLGFFSDAPLLNIVVNTALGKWLFPYAHANRAAAVTYDPDVFVSRLRADISFDVPTLLAVHLTLVHWPYTWASAPSVSRSAPDAEKYRTATARLDEQFADLMNALEDSGALRNALVLVLSDHGESLGEATDLANDVHAARHVPMAGEAYGHGTNVFAPEQYRVLLAMRSFGQSALAQPVIKDVDVPASLEDIAPTIADLLGLSPEQPFDGNSLLPWLQAADPPTPPPDRIRYMETEFNPPGFVPGAISPASAFRGAAAYYRVDPASDRVLVRAEHLEEIMRSRQYAAYREGHLVASVPSDDRTAQHIVHVDLLTGAHAWLDDELAIGTLASEPQELWHALQARFQEVRERPIAAPLGRPE